MSQDKNSKDTNTPISEHDMLDAIKRSGYLIEQRVAKTLKKDYKIVPNQVFIDPDSGKRREFDLLAIKSIYETENHDSLGWELICECENNAQPVVFFKHEFDKNIYTNEIKYSGLFDFLRVRLNNSLQSYPFFMGDFSSQYCTFQLTNKNNHKNWIATHAEDQHNTFEKLLKIVKNRKKDSLKNSFKADPIWFKTHFLLLVLQGDIFIAEEANEEMNLKQVDHVKYRIPDYNLQTGFFENYYVDVIRESFLPNYLQQIEREGMFILEVVRKNREELLNEVKKRYVSMMVV